MRRAATILAGAVLFVAIPVGVSKALTASGPAGRGSVFLPVGNGYVNGCDVERVYTTPAQPAGEPPPGGVSLPTPAATWVQLSNGKAVKLPEGTDPEFVAQEIAAQDCR